MCVSVAAVLFCRVEQRNSGVQRKEEEEGDSKMDIRGKIRRKTSDVCTPVRRRRRRGERRDRKEMEACDCRSFSSVQSEEKKKEERARRKRRKEREEA